MKGCCQVPAQTVHTSPGAVRMGCSIVTRSRAERSKVTRPWFLHGWRIKAPPGNQRPGCLRAEVGRVCVLVRLEVFCLDWAGPSEWRSMQCPHWGFWARLWAISAFMESWCRELQSLKCMYWSLKVRSEFKVGLGSGLDFQSKGLAG